MASQLELLDIVGQINVAVSNWRGDSYREALMDHSVKRHDSKVFKYFRLAMLNQPEIALNCFFNCELDRFLVPLSGNDNEKILEIANVVFLEIITETGEKFFTINNRKVCQEVFLKNTFDLLRFALEELGFMDAKKVKAKLTKKANTLPDKTSSEIEIQEPQPIIIISNNDREAFF
jgi:hypothetical protein